MTRGTARQASRAETCASRSTVSPTADAGFLGDTGITVAGCRWPRAVSSASIRRPRSVPPSQAAYRDALNLTRSYHLHPTLPMQVVSTGQPFT
jgi:hypothetical protein